MVKVFASIVSFLIYAFGNKFVDGKMQKAEMRGFV